MQSAESVLSASTSRRSLVRGAAALGVLALALPAAGCSFLGIEDPTADEPEVVEPELAEGAVDFDGLIVALNLDTSTWMWIKIDNATSSYYGSDVLAIPGSITNNDDQRRVLNGMYCKIIGPDGNAQPDISNYYPTDDMFQRGSISSGSVVSGVLHILYKGSGTYTLSFDNLLGSKAELTLEVDGSLSGISPIPDSSITASDATSAVTYGVPFDVAGLTLTFSADEASYLWTQAWDESDAVWNGRWCVGVPLTMTNSTASPLQLTSDMYGLFAPKYYRLADPAAWFADTSACNVGAIQPGASVTSMMYWPYDEDGWYYAVFDSDGTKVVASARIAQYS